MVRNPILHSDDTLKLHRPFAASKLPTAPGAPRPDLACTATGQADADAVLATISAAITAGYWFLRARSPPCRTTGDVDLRTLDWHHGAAVTALIPALSCRSCRPNAPFAELVGLTKSSVQRQ